jgi:hypothetical protein
MARHLESTVVSVKEETEDQIMNMGRLSTYSFQVIQEHRHLRLQNGLEIISHHISKSSLKIWAMRVDGFTLRMQDLVVQMIRLLFPPETVDHINPD